MVSTWRYLHLFLGRNFRPGFAWPRNSTIDNSINNQPTTTILGSWIHPLPRDENVVSVRDLGMIALLGASSATNLAHRGQDFEKGLEQEAMTSPIWLLCYLHYLFKEGKTNLQIGLVIVHFLSVHLPLELLPETIFDYDEVSSRLHSNREWSFHRGFAPCQGKNRYPLKLFFDLLTLVRRTLWLLIPPWWKGSKSPSTLQISSQN